MVSNFSSNATTSAGSGDKPTWYWVLRGILGFVTVFGNGLVIYIISSRRRLRSQPSPYWFILSLAVADFLVGIFNTPSIFFHQFYLKYDQTVWTIFEFFWNVFLIASTTNICALTLDRYIAVIYPFKHSNFSKESTCILVISFAWTLPVLQRIPFVVLKMGKANKDQYFGYQIFYLLVFILLPNAFLLFAYVRIIIVAKEHRKQIRALTSHEPSATSTESSSNSNSRKEQRNRMRRSYNGTISVGFVVLIFLVCNSFVLYWLSCFYLSEPCKETEATKTYLAMVVLRYINSAPNFFVYSLIKSDFQQELRSIMKCQ